MPVKNLFGHAVKLEIFARINKLTPAPTNAMLQNGSGENAGPLPDDTGCSCWETLIKRKFFY